MMAQIARRLRLFLRSELDLIKDQIKDELTHQGSGVSRSVSEEIRYQAGLAHANWLEGRQFDDIAKAGHRVYSQFGEDGIIQYLIERVPIDNDLFIEFGVEDYRESNTRFLLEKNNWNGVLVDAVPGAKDFLIRSHIYGWRTVDFIESFITRENINDLFAPYKGDVGIISIDIDGVDYHIWEALTVIAPRIVIVEYQSNFGPDLALTVPYRPDFDRTKHHYSNLCFGASLLAMERLGQKKGYSMVGTSDGHNAFFVRNDLVGDLPVVSTAQAYREMRYRDSRDRNFNETYIGGMPNKRRAMSDAIVLDLDSGREVTVAEAFGIAK